MGVEERLSRLQALRRTWASRVRCKKSRDLGVLLKREDKPARQPGVELEEEKETK